MLDVNFRQMSRIQQVNKYDSWEVFVEQCFGIFWS